jgi:hypothetical protein
LPEEDFRAPLQFSRFPPGRRASPRMNLRPLRFQRTESSRCLLPLNLQLPHASANAIAFLRSRQEQFSQSLPEFIRPNCEAAQQLRQRKVRLYIVESRPRQPYTRFSESSNVSSPPLSLLERQ